MPTPAVSIILPTRNRAELLRRSVASVLAQTFRDFELIVVDDGSTDHTVQVLAESGDPRLVVLRREQGGSAAAARNAGIERARGEFLAFQDDDDVWLPHKLERQVQAMREAGDGVVLCLCGYLRWWVWYQGACYIGGDRLFSLLDFSRGQTLDLDYGLVATPAWLVRRDAVQRAGAFDTRMRSWDDLELAMRLQQLGRFIHVAEPLFVQDQVMGSRMMKQFGHFAGDLKVLLEKHGARWEHDVDLTARHYYLLGRLELNYGSRAEARQWFARSARLRPWRTATWLGWLGTWLGQNLFRRVSARFRRALRRDVWWLNGDPALLASTTPERS